MSWFMESSEPEYLDGIRSGVTVFADNRRPVAYAFSEVEGGIMAAGPDLLEALTNVMDVLDSAYRNADERWERESPNHAYRPVLLSEVNETREKVIAARAAIAKATQPTPIMGEDA